MAYGALREDRNIGRTAADINQTHTKLFFVLGKGRGARGKLLKDDFVHFKPASPNAFDNILGCTDSTGYDVYLGLQTHAAHPDRLTYAVLLIDHVFLRENV